jgi:hypothetical protein
MPGIPHVATGRPRGRPKGSKNKTTVDRETALAEAAKLASGKLTEARIKKMSPIAVILYAMQEALRAGAIKSAAAFAVQAAPYVHARLSSSQVDGSFTLTVDDVRRIASIARAEAARRGLCSGSAERSAPGTLPN